MYTLIRNKQINILLIEKNDQTKRTLAYCQKILPIHLARNQIFIVETKGHFRQDQYTIKYLLYLKNISEARPSWKIIHQ